ncbi:class I SAM-dependent methyltransferase [Candidatus Pacearchaeota archaeon]|nr:class I SAM-dependent methyltransferase [Candidatus Pacearchaeota archaeon]
MVDKKILKAMEAASDGVSLEDFGELGKPERYGLTWVDMDKFKTTDPFLEFKKVLPEFELDNWHQEDIKRENMLLLKTTSSLLEQLIINKGGWLFPQKVYYQNPLYLTKAKNHRPELDKFILQLPLCNGLYERYKFVTEDLFPKYIKQKLSEKDEVKIVSLGSGSGDDVFQAMRKFGSNVSFVGYDIDPTAIEVGQKLANEMRLEDRVEFRQETLRKCNHQEFDIAIMVGIICSLPEVVATRVIKQVKPCLKQDGLLIVGAAADKVAYGDPLGRFLAEYGADFFLEHRGYDRMENCASRAGYDILELTKEPAGYNNFVVAKPKE